MGEGEEGAAGEGSGEGKKKQSDDLEDDDYQPGPRSSLLSHPLPIVL
jgi:hypothetical protein